MQQQQDASGGVVLQVPWGDLPGDVLSVIGAQMCCPSQLSSASRVCQAWHASIPQGVERLELDMNPCNEVSMVGSGTAGRQGGPALVQSLEPRLQRRQLC
jgi:hypothetical protein